MPIDPLALERHASAQIAHYAITARYDGVSFSASWRVSRAMLNALDGGIVNVGGGSLHCLKSSFGAGKPEAQERIEVRQSAAGVLPEVWESYSIAAIEGMEDVLSKELLITLEPPELD